MANRKGHKVKITTRALLQRINRKLDSDQEKLCTSRGERAYQDVGRYYIVNYYNNSIAGTDVDPEKLGRELGVLKGYEEVVD